MLFDPTIRGITYRKPYPSVFELFELFELVYYN